MQIDFIYTYNNANSPEGRFFSYGTPAKLFMSDGVGHNSISFKIGERDVLNEWVDCITGVPIKGRLVFNTNSSDFTISVLKIPVSAFGDFVFKNIPIE